MAVHPCLATAAMHLLCAILGAPKFVLCEMPRIGVGWLNYCIAVQSGSEELQ